MNDYGIRIPLEDVDTDDVFEIGRYHVLYINAVVDASKPVETGSWRAISIKIVSYKEMGLSLHQYIWGADVWLNGVPLLKLTAFVCLVLALLL